MKFKLLTVVLLFCCIVAVGQNALPPSGFVGIGTATPGAQLHVSDIYPAGGINLLLGDDSFLSDVDVANILGLYGVQNNDRAGLKLGSSGPTLFGINGGLGIGTITPLPQTTLHVYEGGSSINTWRGRVVSSGENNAVVMGEYESKACIGAHNPQLTTWSDLSIQHGGGKVGIGTLSPRGKFDVDGAGDIYLSDDPNAGTTQSLYIPGHIFISPYNGGDISYLQARRMNSSGTTALQIRTFDNGALTQAIQIEGNGNVGIGTTHPTQKLTVNGTIYGKEVQVDLNVPGPDYVFEKDYALPSLEEVKSYIEENKHLPEVPSAKEMEANGINVGEMNMILLKKVEELTLYVIELKRENEAQNEMITELKKKK